jgi:hypothetical protein
MACFQRGKPFFIIEANDKMSNRIAAFAPCQLGGLGKGVTVCYRKHLLGMDDLIRRHPQGATELF